MNTTKLLKNFNAKTLEKTIANLVNINRIEIVLTYAAFDENHHIVNREDYIVNPYSYRTCYPCGEKRCSSVSKAVDKILTAHPNARLNDVEFKIFVERVDISFFEDIK